MKNFDLLKCPLEGVNLIEASAGTGKTYALAGLFLRCILEKKIDARRILVITFTNAATAELKSRIRQMIIDARLAFLSGETPQEFFHQLLAEHSDPQSRKTMVQRCNEALANYDETAIYTIHGFCQRVLSDNAFAGGILFDMDIIADQTSLEKEFVEDFWRRHFYETDPMMAHYAVKMGITIETFMDLLQVAMNRSDIKIIPENIPFSRTALGRELENFHEQLRVFKKRWKVEKDTIAALLRNEALSGVIYGKKAEGILTEIEQFFHVDEMSFPIPSCIRKLSAEELKRKTKKNHETPSHEIFDLCRLLCDQSDRITSMLNHYFMELKKKFLESAKVDFPKLKKQKNILYFDDLLHRVYEAVSNPGGERFAELLRDQYSVVLVDEFQDRDPVQYAILRSVFLKEHQDEDHTIFFIGDPKQSIYGFRGADIFAYLRAQKNIHRRYTMKYNWRSEQSLINAINVLFGTPTKPFVYDDIVYTPVEKPTGQKTDAIMIEGKNDAGMHWWFIPAQEDGKPMGVMVARERIIPLVIQEISELLKAGFEKKAFIGDQPISADDIAILVRKNSEAHAFKNALTDAGIPSVVYSTESIYLSDQAEDIRRFMLGIISSENEGYLLSALNTPLFAYSGEDIVLLKQNDKHFQYVKTCFEHLKDVWEKKGFLTMFCGLLEQEDVRARISSHREAEKLLTNYMHLAHLLFSIQKNHHLQPLELLQRLESMMVQPDNQLEEQQQKLETDRHCVRVVTIHRSKGLEYPIVFCPFAWEGWQKLDDQAPVFYHDDQNFWEQQVDLGSEGLTENISKAEKELLAEDCRLLYVSLTRAKNRCYFVTGNIGDSRTRTVNYLFHRKFFENEEKIPENLELIRDIEDLVSRAPLDFKIKILGEFRETPHFASEKPKISISCREFKGNIKNSWKIASYTYLTKSGHSESEWDEDDTKDLFDKGEENGELGKSILTFPAGATSGLLLHEILEKVHFSGVDTPDTCNTILEVLNKYNYSEIWKDPIQEMLGALVHTDLFLPGRQSFRLAQISPDACLKEMAFYFPLKKIDIRKVISILDNRSDRFDHGKAYEEKRRISPSVIEGFFKGFIDLVFEHKGRYYLADWKSNKLGMRPEDYDQDKMEREIYKSFYDLQYMIYTMALNQYLKQRIPNYCYEKYFGGVFYFFLRGIGLNSEPSSRGVFFDRPPQISIDLLSDMLLDQSHIIHPSIGEPLS